ncbi:LPS export ABC transporter periplasmic protein LptC [Dysgonomonas sp. ZJ279]|uniref:LPS export ABC transporter periplasmic protein LptC n=1 Tax=Dysgonomonas sp. ZJ279 TaxID=2709796 RepID=UPI0013EC32FB|nr:LPS export ABC transporter periplasmic protein LptC [Dysgonomonas sp. ZJ279]
MSKFKSKKVISIVVILGIIALIAYSMFGEKKETDEPVDLVYNPDSIPMLNTDSVTMLISDSGLIRYKMLAKTWLVFSEAKDPYWLFPDGFYGEQFDSLFNIILTVKADSVWNFEKRKLWQLRGNVFIRNSVGETFASEELFWDQRDQKIYSNQFVEINRPEKGILRGSGGFEANQQMTEYKFAKVRNSEIYVNEDNEADEEKIE